jgi:hypothetical protein
MMMKYLNMITYVALISLLMMITGCEESTVDPIVALDASEVSNLDAVSPENFTLFSFANNVVVDNSDSATTQWDIGFRGTTIILNSGVSGPGQAAGQMVNGIFEELETAPTDGYAQDSESAMAIPGSGGWYTYTGTTSVPNHAILPNAGKILVLKTADQKFVKVEILSYYQGNPSTTTEEFADLATRPASRYYTFRFIFQPDGTGNLATE